MTGITVFTDGSALVDGQPVPKLTRVQRQVLTRMYAEGLELMGADDGSAWLYDTSEHPWKMVAPVSNVTAERLILRNLVQCRLTRLGMAALGVTTRTLAGRG